MRKRYTGGEGWETLPQELRELTRYLPWISVARPNGTTGKCPVQARGQTLFPVRATSETAWRTLKDALRWVRRGQAHGVGLCLPPGLIALDIDGVCRNGVLDGWAQEVIEEAGSYAEWSPSGTGVHILGRHPAERLPGRLPADPRVEVLTAGRYITVTGRTLCPELLSDLSHIVPVPETNLVPASGAPPVANPAALIGRIRAGRSGARFERLYHDGDTAEYPSASEADLALCKILSWWCGNNIRVMDEIFRTSSLYREKWDSHVAGTQTYGERTLLKALG